MKTNPELLTPIAQRYTQVFYHLFAHRYIRTRAEFCAQAHLSPCYFRAFEDGTRYPTLTNICDLIEAYSVNPSWLLCGRGKMFR